MKFIFNLNDRTELTAMLFVSVLLAECPGSSSGKATFYDSQGGYGHCGNQIPNEGLYAAVSSGCYSESICGKHVRVSYEGKSVVVPILDSCQGCDSSHIDISRNAFQKIADLNKGIIQVSWEFITNVNDQKQMDNKIKQRPKL